jgi:DNA mismatch endonuclease, patch repair protein
MTRSEVMSRVRGKDTGPEMTVRRALWAAGLRYRLHDERLPGRPDIVLSSKRIVLLVHGCFWHGHEGCPRHRIPKSRVEWWTAKINRNKERDAQVRAELTAGGWSVLVIWECEVESLAKLGELVAAIKTAPAVPRRQR